MEDFSGLKIKIASPQEILAWSYGEVTKPETINYRTQKPEKDGLFSERIFGPTRDWECYCGKYRRIRYKGVICDKCGVEVTRSIVRRERMGHINLATPVAHIWFLKNSPSRLSLVLDIPLLQLEKVVYYNSFIITDINEENKKRVLAEVDKEFRARKKSGEEEDPEKLKVATQRTRQGLESLEVGQVIDDISYSNLARRFADVFEAKTGAEAIRTILERIDLDKLALDIEKEIRDQRVPEQKALKRLKLVRSMIANSIRPEWMIMTVLPILPPDLRPMVALDGGRYATSDLNDLYRRVINRNNRLKKLMELEAPDVILTNEKRMLQEAVDALIDNSARFGTQQLSTQHRPLRSLADMLKGKQGRFRQNLLGKRVDYSGRSVIVVGQELKLDECSLPKKMALELFRPFVIHEILKREMAFNIKNANRLIEEAPPEVWAILEEVISTRKVLLNRAPTLHRLGIQAFKPLLVEDLVIRIPPMVCPAFNADFDGDQMAVHLPLTEEAQKEASQLMISSHNLLKPANGEPIAVPTQDIVLGIYFITNIRPNAKGTGKSFVNAEEALLAYEFGALDINALVKIGNKENRLETSCGRVLFNQVLPQDFGFINEALDKKTLTKLVGRLVNRYGQEMTSSILDKIKKIGFENATKSGITWGMDDLITPKEKQGLIKKAEGEVALIENQYTEGLLTLAERRARIISVWEKVKAEIAKIVPQSLDFYNSVHMIIASGSRGSWSQPTQMMGMKGLVVNPNNEIIELPIKASYKEGFSVLEYFISNHGARKGSTDTALKTASAGYLTRRLVDVSQDLIIRENNCRTKEGIEINRIEGQKYGHNFGNRLFSRVPLEDIKEGNHVLAKALEVIDRPTADLIDKSKINIAKVRSPITCKTLYGVCVLCYGYDLGKNKLIEAGEAVGIVAAQSIGEPGTQLTMRTFHTGGIAGVDITHGLPRIEEIFECREPKGKAIISPIDGFVIGIEDKELSRTIRVKVIDGKKKEKVIEYSTPRFTTLFVKIGDTIKKGDQLCEGPIDPRDIFALRGREEAEHYIIDEVQKIYVAEGAAINDKHIEVIVRQMFSRVRIKEAGDTHFIVGEIVEKSRFLEINREMKRQGKQPARAQQLLLGIIKVALSSESFLSAASFQETARVLVRVASEGRVDSLRGLKENVIIGRLVPAGTHFRKMMEGSSHEETREEVGDEKVAA